MLTDPYIARTLAAGAGAAVATTAAITAMGRREDVSGWAPFNAVSHIAWGDRAISQTGRSLQFTATGVALNAMAMVGWGAVYACLAGRDRRSPTRSLVASVATAAAAYVVDYHVVPKRFTPGFEHRLSERSMWVIYGALAAGLCIGDDLRGRFSLGA